MANTNVLAGYACPHCRSEGPFEVFMSVTVSVPVYDDGYDLGGFGSTCSVYADTLTDESSEWECVSCKKKGPPSDFVVGSARWTLLRFTHHGTGGTIGNTEKED